MTDCKNCGNTFEGKFCPNCSQKADTHRLTLGHLAHETTHAVTHTDKGILLLIKAMFTKPGYVAREYVEGQRKKYFNPLTFILIMMAVQVFATKHTNFYGKFTRQLQDLVQAASPKARQSKEFNDRMEQADKQMTFANENNKLINFIFIPFLSLLTWFFFKESKFNYAENLILNVLIGGQLVVWFLLVCIIPALISTRLIIVVTYIFVLVSIGYAIIAYKQFYRQKWRWTILKGVTLQIIYILVLGFISDNLAKILVS